MKNKKTLMLAIMIVVLATAATAELQLICNNFCYLADDQGILPTITNNPDPSFSVRFQPASLVADNTISKIIDRTTLVTQVAGATFDITPISTSDTQVILQYRGNQNLATGNYKIIAAATGNVGTFSKTFDFDVDTTGPQVTAFTASDDTNTLSSQFQQPFILGEGNDLTLSITVEDTEKKNIAETEVLGVNITIQGQTLPLTKTGITFSITLPNIDKGPQTATLELFDTLRNRVEQSFDFTVEDILPPVATLLSPFGGTTNLDFPNLAFSFNEPATCKLFRVAEGVQTLKQEFNTRESEHTFTSIPLDTIDPNDANANVVNEFSLNCTDEKGNEGSQAFTIVYVIRLPLIEEFKSSRGDFIISFLNGKITDLVAETNAPTSCFFKGGIDTVANPQLGPTGNPAQQEAQMTNFGDGVKQDHTFDLTAIIEPETPREIEYKFFALCREQGTNVYTILAETAFTVNLALSIIGTSPHGKVGTTTPEIAFNLTRPAFCTADNVQLNTQQQQEFSFTSKELAAGPNTIAIDCSLPSSQADSESISFEVDIFTPPPTAITITDSGGNNIVGTTPENDMVIIGEVETNATVVITIIDDQGETVGQTTTTANDSGDFNAPITLPDESGTFDVNIIVTDEVGNTATTTVQIVLDNQGPQNIVVENLPLSTTTNVNIIGFTNETNTGVTIEVESVDNEFEDTKIFFGQGTNVIATQLDTFNLLPSQGTTPAYPASSSFVRKTREDNQPFGIGNFITFENHDRAGLLHYRISAIEPTAITQRIFLQPPLEQPVPEGTEVTVFTQDRPTGHVNISVVLYEGLNNIFIRANDSLGNEVPKVIRQVTVDTLNPLLTTDTPTITNNNITLVQAILDGTGTAIDESTITLQITAGACQTPLMTTSSGITFADNKVSYDNAVEKKCSNRKEYPDDIYSVTVEAKDLAGNSFSDTFTFEINQNVANIEIITFTPATEIAKKQHSRDIDTISVTFDGEVEVTSAVINNGVQDFTLSTPATQTTEGTSFIFNPPNLPEDSYTFSISAKKKVNGAFLTANTLAFDLIIDLSGPGISILHDLKSKINYTEPINLRIQLDDTTGVDSLSTKVVFAGTERTMDLNNNIFNATLTPAIANEGTQVIQYKTKDLLGNENNAITQSIEIVDEIGPLITNNNPTGTIKIQQPTLSVNAVDPKGVKSVSFIIEGKSTITRPTTKAGDVFSFPIDSSILNSGTGNAGKNTITTVAIDNDDFESRLIWELFVNPDKGDIDSVTLSKPNEQEPVDILLNRYTNKGPIFNLLCVTFKTDVNILTATLKKQATFFDLDDQNVASNNKYCYGLNGGTGLLEEGNYEIALTSDDSVPYTIPIVIDRTPPTIQPSDNIILFTIGSIVEVNGTILDSNPVNITVNSNLARLNGDNFAFNVTLGEGDNTITLTTTDQAGNTGTETITIARDNTGPSTLTLDPLTTPTGKDEINITGATEPNAIVTLFSSERAIISQTTANPTEQKSQTRNPLSPRNAGAASIFFGRDTDNIFVVGKFLGIDASSQRIEISGVTTDLFQTKVSLAKNLPFAITTDTRIITFDTAFPEGLFTIPVDLIDNANQFFITATDQAGNLLTQGNGEVEINVFKDKTPPSITLNTPQDAEIVSNDQQTITFTLDDTDASVDAGSINLNIQGPCNISGINNTSTLSINVNQAEFSIDNKQLCNGDETFPSGTYFLNITAADTFANVNNKKFSFTVDTNVPQNPSLSVNGGVVRDNNVTTNTSSPIVTLRYTQSEVIQIASLKIDNKAIALADITKINDHTFSFRPSTLTEGPHTLQVVASKEIAQATFGNTNTLSTTLTVDTQPPTLLLERFLEKVTQETVTINGTCGDSLSKDEDLSIVLIENNFPNPISCSNGKFEFKNFLLSIEEGQKTVSITIQDIVNNSFTISGTVELDSTSPELDITRVTNPDIDFNNPPFETDEEVIIFQGTVGDNNLDNITVFINDEEIETITTINPDGTLTITIDLIGNPGEEQENNITIIATDTFGLTNTTTLQVIKDQKGPGIAQFIPLTNSTNTTQPLLQITTSEFATTCTITYEQAAVSGTKTDTFTTTNNRNFEVTLSTPIQNIPADEKEETLIISCSDSLDNTASNTKQLTIDLKNPIIKTFDVDFFSKKLIATKTDLKHLLITEIPPNSAIRLNATTSEPATCTYRDATGTFNFESTDIITSHKTDLISLEDISDTLYEIICKDASGRPTISKFINLSVNTQLEPSSPLITISNPVSNSNLFGDNTPRVQTTTPSINGTIQSLTPGIDISVARLTVNGTNYDLTLNQQGFFSQTINQLPGEGSFSLQVFAVNEKGNSSAISQVFQVDTSGPKACITIAGQKVCADTASQQSTTTSSEQQGVVCGDNKCEFQESCIPDCTISLPSLLSVAIEENTDEIIYHSLYSTLGGVQNIEITITDKEQITKAKLKQVVKRNGLEFTTNSLASGPGIVAWRGNTQDTHYQITAQQLFTENTTATLTNQYLTKFLPSIN